MGGKIWRVSGLAVMCALLTLGSSSAWAQKPTDEGSAEDFKGKTFDLKEKGKANIYLTFPANTKATVTVKSTGKPDVNLYVYRAVTLGKLVAKDDSPGPNCEVSFTLKKAGKLRLSVQNKGPGATKATLKVSLAKPKPKG